MDNLKPYAKAIVGGLVAGLTAFGTALTDNIVTGPEWIAIALAAIAGTGFVYATPNKPVE